MNDTLAMIVGILMILAAAMAVIVLLFVGIKVAILEPGCDQRAEEMGVVDGDYRLLSDTCWLTLRDGRKLPADQVRGVEGLER